MRSAGRIRFQLFIFAELLFAVCSCFGQASPQLDVVFSSPGSDSLVANVSVDPVPGLRYSLLRSTDLSQWEEMQDSSPQTKEGVEVEWSSNSPRVFFKVRVEIDDSIGSRITLIEYPVHVFLPLGYGESTRRYPIVYATDGQWVTEGFSQAVAGKGKQLILVTVEQGPGDRRAIDFLLPGAYDYLRFLGEELLPAVESIYRVDTSERTLCGTSYGGLLVGLVFILDDVEEPLFRNYLSFDGSFWSKSSTMYALEDERYAASSQKHATLYLTSATGRTNNDRWVNAFERRIESRGYEGLRIIRRSYPVEHNDVAQPSFDDALDLLFE